MNTQRKAKDSMTPYDRLLLPENLYYAWRKAQNLYRMDDGHVNHGELLEFELDLENRLQKIADQFSEGEYKLQNLRPLPRPKKTKNGKYIDRQYYHVAVDDQVAWIAVVNALGPEIDSKMPAWSYGHRLYRPAWYEEKEGRKSKLEIGPYRHASGHLYRKFQHSWPLFRKHVSLTARAMTREIIYDSESESDKKALNAAISADLPYLRKGFWDQAQQKGNDLYHASIDLERFYPNIPIEKILEGLMPAGNSFDKDKELLSSLLGSMLKFTLDESDITPSISDNVVPKFSENVKGLPTGLFAAGFLANVAMLPVDKEVNEKLRQEELIAHFRFVDDHAFLAYDFDKLCKWIKWYKGLVKEQIDIEINEEKYNPGSLSRLFDCSEKSNNSEIENNKETAKIESKIDGTNPIKLLTKTLEKVSTIAFQNTDILDDPALKSRMEELEWLLLADIPEREIRPDTRAAFAAGQMVALAPMLIQETDNIVDIHREITRIENEIQSLKEHHESNIEKIKKFEKESEKQKGFLRKLNKKLIKDEKKHLSKRFKLLLDAMKNHPEKARLFLRLHQYCLQTGHQGLGQITRWINDLRTKTNIWADYYSSLTLQILAQNILKAIKTCTTPSMLRSDQKAAKSYLESIAKIKQSNFKVNVNDKNKPWFHKVAMREYTVSVFIATEYLKKHDLKLSNRFENAMKPLDLPNCSDDSSAWLKKTGYASGNWAYFAEKNLSMDNLDSLDISSNPTCLWEIFIKGFDYGKISDQRAIRLYPEALPPEAWKHFLKPTLEIKDDDSGWIYDVIKTKPKRIEDAKNSAPKAFKRAIKALSKDIQETHISIADWTEYINSNRCNPFDPRKSEWTALEIIKRVAKLKLKPGKDNSLRQIHPQNILIPKSWKDIEKNKDGSLLSWEEWRFHINTSPKIKFSKPKDFLIDYRYHNHKNDTNVEEECDDARLNLENKFESLGKLLLGLLCGSHSVPARWNIRGNERAVNIPRTRIFRSLAISSSTLLLIEGCIAPRSAESRLIINCPALFGLQDDKTANDTQYDPPPLNSLEDLDTAITDAQDILCENQLAVSRHQPRQLIPFNILAFAVSENDEPTEHTDAE